MSDLGDFKRLVYEPEVARLKEHISELHERSRWWEQERHSNWFGYACGHGHQWISGEPSSRCPNCGTSIFKPEDTPVLKGDPLDDSEDPMWEIAPDSQALSEDTA